MPVASFIYNTDYTRATDALILKAMVRRYQTVHMCATQARRSSARTTGPHLRRGTGQTSWTHPPAEFHFITKM